MLNIGDKLYPIDYMDMGLSYTVVSTDYVEENGIIKSGQWYLIHCDKIEEPKGLYEIHESKIDSEPAVGHMFTTPQKAVEAYTRYKEFQNSEIEKEIQ